MLKKGVYYCVKCKLQRYFEFGKCGVCNSEYKDWVSDFGVTASGESILNCGVHDRVNSSWTNIYWDDYSDEKKEWLKDDVGFNPELVICRGLKNSRNDIPCRNVRDCFQYHCVDYDNFKVCDDYEVDFEQNR